MVQSATVRFEGVASLSTAASFDAGRLTSDGGLPWLAEADQALGLCAAVAACVPEWRHRRTRHSRSGARLARTVNPSFERCPLWPHNRTYGDHRFSFRGQEAGGDYS